MKWTIEMSNKELARKTEVERVLDQRITQKEAAKKLEVSERQFRRILYRYRQEGDGDRCFEIHAGVMPESQQIGACLATVIEDYDLNLTYDYIDDESAYTLSDHYAFWQQGVPGVMIVENFSYQPGKACENADRNYHYHQITDTVTYIIRIQGMPSSRQGLPG